MPCTGGPGSYPEVEVRYVRSHDDAESIKNLMAEVNRLTAELCSYNRAVKNFLTGLEQTPIMWSRFQKSLSPSLRKWLKDHEASDAARKAGAAREIKEVLKKYNLDLNEVELGIQSQ